MEVAMTQPTDPSLPGPAPVPEPTAPVPAPPVPAPPAQAPGGYSASPYPPQQGYYDPNVTGPIPNQTGPVPQYPPQGYPPQGWTAPQPAQPPKPAGPPLSEVLMKKFRDEKLWVTILRYGGLGAAALIAIDGCLRFIWSLVVYGDAAGGFSTFLTAVEYLFGKLIWAVLVLAGTSVVANIGDDTDALRQKLTGESSTVEDLDIKKLTS
jgi:hypothetical protein